MTTTPAALAAELRRIGGPLLPGEIRTRNSAAALLESFAREKAGLCKALRAYRRAHDWQITAPGVECHCQECETARSLLITPRAEAPKEAKPC